MPDPCFAIILVHGEGASDHAEQLQAHYAASRAVTELDDLQNGDLLLRENDQDGLEWVASNVLLLEDMRAPMVRLVALDDALAELAGA